MTKPVCVWVLLTMLFITSKSECTPKPDPLLLWYQQSATVWQTQALPIGNGRLGCMVFGGVPEEHIQFNEISLWTGDEKDTGSYQNFGDLHIRLNHGAASDYKRSLDISKAIAEVSYTSDGVKYQRKVFSSAGAQVIVICLTANKPGSYSGSLRMVDAHNAATVASENTLSFAAALPNGLKYEARLSVLPEGGTLKAAGDQLVFDKADGLTIYLDARTNYLNKYEANWRGEDPHSQLMRELQSASQKSYTSLLKSHIADHQRLFNRVSLDVGKTVESQKSLPTDKRLEAYTKGAVDPELEALFFQFGRYLLIS